MGHGRRRGKLVGIRPASSPFNLQHNANEMRTLFSLFAIQSIRSSTRTTSRMAVTKSLVVDPFCYRQFEGHESSKTYGGTVL
jgi:hypothetical protein